MKNITKYKLVFASLVFPFSLMMSGCSDNPPQTDNMTSNSMAPSAMGHMDSHSTNMAASSMNNMTSNNMNMTNPSPTGNMMSDSMTTSDQSQMKGMTTNSMNNMAAPKTGNMESH